MPINYLKGADRKEKILILWIALFSSAVIYSYIQIRDTSHQNKENIITVRRQQSLIKQLVIAGVDAHNGICAVRDNFRDSNKDDRAQIRQSKLFLKEHPNGIPGITAAVIRRSIHTQELAVIRRVGLVTVLTQKGKCPQ